METQPQPGTITVVPPTFAKLDDETAKYIFKIMPTIIVMVIAAHPMLHLGLSYPYPKYQPLWSNSLAGHKK